MAIIVLFPGNHLANTLFFHLGDNLKEPSNFLSACLQKIWELLQSYRLNLNYRSLTVCSCHVTYAFQSESILYSCLNVKELLARSRREIWRWSDCIKHGRLSAIWSVWKLGFPKIPKTSLKYIHGKVHMWRPHVNTYDILLSKNKISNYIWVKK